MQRFFDSSRPKSMARASLAVVLAISFAVNLWFAFSHRGLAATTCTICHKRTTTLIVTCGSIDYQRHKDHGDTDGPCEASQ